MNCSSKHIFTIPRALVYSFGTVSIIHVIQLTRRMSFHLPVCNKFMLKIVINLSENLELVKLVSLTFFDKRVTRVVNLIQWIHWIYHVQWTSIGHDVHWLSCPMVFNESNGSIGSISDVQWPCPMDMSNGSNECPMDPSKWIQCTQSPNLVW